MSGRVDAVVVGAGVIGLTTGIRLAEADHRVAIVCADDPSETTSVLATAMVGPTFDFNGPRASAWEAETVATFLAALDAPGVQQCRGRFIAPSAGFVPPGADQLPGFSQCAATDTPAGYKTAFWAEVPLVDMPRYLPYLVERFEDAASDSGPHDPRCASSQIGSVTRPSSRTTDTAASGSRSRGVAQPRPCACSRTERCPSDSTDPDFLRAFDIERMFE